ncbi:hypothetical protein DIW83_03710 [Acinetobacter nosocomialis]|nr:hypothetical protein DIW83_03710 [Acinetobacter nosocomialis]
MTLEGWFLIQPPSSQANDFAFLTSPLHTFRFDLYGEEREYPMNGNAYILQNGKTIATYACHQYG